MTKIDPAILDRRAAVLAERVASEPTDASAWYGLGRALAGLERHDEAIAALRSALAANPQYSAAHRELGRSLLAGGDPHAAIAAFETGIEVAEARGDLQTAREMRTFARRAARAANAANAANATPGGGEAADGDAPAEASGEPAYTPAMSAARDLYKQGFDHFVKGEVDEAIALYRQAIEAEPELAIAWNGLSVALARKPDFDEAIAAARRLLELEPEDPLSHTNLSRLLMQAGRIPEAEDAKAQAMQLQIKQSGR